MSIATKRGDGGQTGLAGGIRVSKINPRVECYGTIDELISQMGFARAICADADVAGRIERIQRELYKVGSAIATPPESKKTPPEITTAMVDALEAEVHQMEAEPGVLGDWSLPGGAPDSAALDVARTVCRRAERLATGLMEAGVIQPPRYWLILIASRMFCGCTGDCSKRAVVSILLCARRIKQGRAGRARGSDD